MLETLQSLFTQDASLWSLLAGSFVAATLVPVSSELMLFAVLSLHPGLAWEAVAVATLGNTAGGMTSYGLGRFIPHRMRIAHQARLRRFGEPLLLLSWLPLVGDALCVGAGWLRLNGWHCLAYMAIGKCLRYAILAAAMFP